jgi:hypothetical protein
MNRAGQFAAVFFDQSYDVVSGLPYDYVRGRVFGANGQAIGTNYFTLNDQPRSDGYFAAYRPVVAMAPDGSSVYVWDDLYLYRYGSYPARDIYARRADAAGKLTGEPFRLNTTVNCSHEAPEIAMSTNGSFIVVWTQFSSEADGVYLQRFDAEGNYVGPELRVSPYNGTAPQVAIAGDGRFVVAWQGQDNDGSGIFAQRFLADGSFYGDTLWVNEGATNSQTSPLLAMADNGTSIVKWSEGTNNFARWISWDATNQMQILGPRVQSMFPALSASAPITNVMVTFDRVMNAATFTPTNAQLIDPVGRIAPVTSVLTADNRTFTLGFATQQLPGRYQVKIGPKVQDVSGSLMDENGNTINGEASDGFSGQFTLLSSATAAFPVAEGFEGGPDVLVGWSFVTYGKGVVSIISSNSPYKGSCHLFFDTPFRDGASQWATLAVDLSNQANQTDLFLEFAAKKTSSTGLLYVEASSDLKSWKQISPTALPSPSTSVIF